MNINQQLLATFVIFIGCILGVTIDESTGFPEEVVKEDMTINRDNIQSLIENTPLLMIFFYDRQDSRMEKTLVNVRTASANLQKDGIQMSLGLFEAPVTPKIETTYHVYQFPKLLVFLNGVRHPLEAPPYPKQIEAFVKRIVREQDQTISTRLRDKTMFGTYLETEGTLILYCGFSRKDSQFNTYETVAKDANQVYLHSFDQDMCRWIHLRYLGLENR